MRLSGRGLQLAAVAAALAAAPALAQPAEAPPGKGALFTGPALGGLGTGGGIPLIKAQAPAPDAGAPAPAPPNRPDEDALFGGGQPAPPPDRPSEDALFGGGPAEERPDGGTSPAVSPNEIGSGGRDEEALRGGGQSRFDTNEQESDPLRIGGMLYLRGQANITQDTPFEDNAFSAPMLIDNYLDARPNDRVRGFVLGRLRYDPTLVQGSGSTLGVPGLGAQGRDNPAVSLDQLWLRFDILQRVYFTVGRQKVRWGVGKLWNPTDFLNQQPRDPLAPFDLRPGINAVKVHVPIESLGWNFYGLGLLDNAGPANVIGNLGGALRAELVLWKAELGLSGVWVNQRTPRYGIDLSMPLGPIDIYGEIAFRSARDFHKWRFAQDFDQIDWANPVAAIEEYRDTGITIQTTGGVSFSFNYTDTNTLTIGAEYFYNRPGYDSPVLYPWLLYRGEFTPLYLGQHYAGVFILAPGLPGNLTWITVTLNALMNISDPSGIVRLDAFFRVLTFLSVEVFGAVNFGVKGGEFRFGLDIPSIPLPDGSMTPEVKVPYSAGSFGLGLRLSI